jgi:putative membrane protein
MLFLGSDLSPAERAKVTEAITAAEAHTSGEIVVVAARQSDDYIHVPIHIATALALVVPLAEPLLARFASWSAITIGQLFLVQLITFITAALILSFPALHYLVTPKKLMKKYAHRNAASQFLASKMSTTLERTGVMIFVSLLEHYVEVIGDKAIADKLTPHDWQKIVDEMLPLLKENQTTDALVLAVQRCGALLAKHFPAGRHNPNELSDHFIVLD